jgi:hypothetical protein
MIALSFEVFFVIIDCHFIAMGVFYIGSLRNFVDCLLFFFLYKLCVCVLICLVLLMDGFPSLIFIYRVFIFVF